MQSNDFGEDVVFSLPNPKWRTAALGAGFVVFSAFPYLFDDKDDARLMLLRVICPVLTLVGAWFLWRAVGLFRTEALSVVVTSRYLQLPVVRGARPEDNRVPLEDIERVMSRSQNGYRQGLVFETSDGQKHTILAMMLPEHLEAAIGGLVLQRGALRRAGVTSREELCAAEAYLDAASRGERPFGVQVSRGKGKRSLVVLARRPGERAPKKGTVVYVPEQVLAVLGHAEGGSDHLRPLRGVD